MHKDTTAVKTRHRYDARAFAATLTTVLAMFVPVAGGQTASYTLTVTATHGSVAVSPARAQYAAGEQVELIPHPETGYHFTGWSGDVHEKGLVLNLTMDSHKSIVANFGPWAPPIGIPVPDFGIFETYRMYDDPGKRNPALTYTQNTEGGVYTHYIDNTNPNATDTSNPYGTASRPRRTIPRPLAAGSVVEVYGADPLSASGRFGTTLIDGVGTAERPIFVRGVNLPRLNHALEIGQWANAQYIIVEGLGLYAGTISARADEAVFSTSHIVVRNSDFRGDETGGGLGVLNLTANNSVDHIVFYGNTVHDTGIWDPLIAVGDQDTIGIAVYGRRMSYVWALDSEIYHVAGDAFTVNAGVADQSTVHHIYLGRTVSRHNKQSGIWAKEAVDIVYSQNEVYGHRQSSSSVGAGMGFQYAPQRIWFLFNTIHDNEFGIAVGSDSGMGFGTEAYFIGNLIYNNHYDPRYHSTSYNPNSIWSQAAINTWGGVNRYFIGNTIYDAEAGIYMPSASSGSAYFANNIISNIGTQGESHIWVGEYDGAFSWRLDNNLLYQPGSSGRIRRASTVYSTSTLPAVNGTNNIDADPKFVDPGNDFRLQPTSPAINAGTGSGVVAQVFDRFQQLYGIDIRKDIEGKTRPQSLAWDIGAYEYPSGSSSDTTPPGNVSSFTAAAGDGQISLSWTNPSDADFAGVRILRKTGSAPTGPTDGAVVYQGTGTSQVDTGLTNGTTYYYRAFAYDEVPNYSSGVMASGTPTTGADTTPPGNVSGLTATPGDTQISLSWTNPSDADFAGVRILRKTGSAPTGPTDGAVVYQGTGTSQVDTGLTNGTTYYYRAFAYDEVPNYSSGATVSAVPQGTDVTAPSVNASYPAADAIQVAVNPLIVLTVSDGGSGVDASTVAIRVNNQPVYSGDSSLYESAYGTCRRTGTRASYHYYYHSAQVFDFDQRVTVQVNASDAVHNAMTPLSYQFVTQMRSFGRNQPVSSEGDSSGAPALATDSQGNLWAVWHAGPAGAKDIYVAKRGGLLPQWGAPVRLTNLASDQCNPAIAVGPDDALYVAWQDNRRGNWDICVSASSDGSTWGEPVRVTDTDYSQLNPVIAVDQASPYRVYIAWERGNAGSRDIYVASSSTSFASKTIAQVTSDPADQAEPALAVGADNTAYLVWTDQRNGSADLYGSSSAVSSWANVPIVTGPGNQSNASLAVEPGTSALHVLWVDDTAGNLDVFYGASDGLPGSPISGTRIVDDTTNAGQSAPRIVAAQDHWDNTHVYACWQDGRAAGSAHDTDLYFAEIRSGAGGTNILVGDDATNSDQADPALGYDEYGHPVVLWTDSRGSTPRIYSASSVYMRPGTPLASTLIARATGGRVGTDPASIDDTGDVSIQVPASAYDCDVTISISEIQNLPRFTSSCLLGYEIGPSGVQFSFPATVTIPYTSSGSGRATPYWYDAQTGTLSQEGMTEITNRTLGNGIPLVSFKTSHLTTFFLLENPLPNGSSRGGGGCAMSSAHGGNILEFVLPLTVLVPFLYVWRRRERRQKEISKDGYSP